MSRTKYRLSLASLLTLLLITALFSQHLATLKAITATPRPGLNVALHKPVTVSHEQSTNPGINAVDGDTTTRWSAQYFPAWIVIDLGAVYAVDRTELWPYQNRAYQYKTEFSTNGTTYTKVTDRTTNTVGTTVFTDYTMNATARYVRFTITGVAGNITTWSAITELRVFGYPAPTNTPTSTNTVCPLATSVPPPSVQPVVSPTNALSQVISVAGSSASWTKVTVSVAAGGTTTSYVDTVAPFDITINLSPNTTHNLTVSAVVPISSSGCQYGGYTVSTTRDRLGNPLTIVQSSSTVPTNTPTPTITPTKSPTVVCPVGTAVPGPSVDPVVSPTSALSQVITVAGSSASWTKVTVSVAAGGTTTIYEDTTAPFQITINLLSNMTHNLTVSATVPVTTNSGGCTYGGYTLSTTRDRLGNPLTIVQTNGTITPTASPTATKTPFMTGT